MNKRYNLSKTSHIPENIYINTFLFIPVYLHPKLEAETELFLLSNGQAAYTGVFYLKQFLRKENWNKKDQIMTLFHLKNVIVSVVLRFHWGLLLWSLICFLLVAFSFLFSPPPFFFFFLELNYKPILMGVLAEKSKLHYCVGP